MEPPETGPLGALRVVEIATEIAGPYCGKLLAELGAQVTKLEPPDGDPLRRWGPFPGDVPDPERSGLFHYLNAHKRGVTLDLGERHEHVLDLVARADVLIESHRPGTLDGFGLGVDALAAANPRLVVVRLSSFGQSGPSRDREATSLTLQAASGWITRRDPDRPPVQGGARIPEYLAGAFAAVGALTALRQRDRGDSAPIEVDVSLLECFLCTLSYPMLLYERMRALGVPTTTRTGPILGIVRCRNGWIGINCLTGQHWLELCTMLEMPDYAGLQMAVMLGGPERPAFYARAQPWLDARSVEEILELSQAFRIPAAPVADGRTQLAVPPYAERDFFVESGDSRLRFTQPRAPYRLSRTPPLPPGPVPMLDASPREASAGSPRPRSVPARASAGEANALPFTGLVVLDLSSFWAGAYATCYLGALGADIIKIESIQRPDGHRYSGVFPVEGESWYESSPLWQATNLNKRDLTLDLGSNEGRALLRRLLAGADVVVENFAPRVMEQFELDYDSLAAIKPEVIQLRMPGFGLVGSWRNFVGWALSFEQISGMAAVTGYPDGPPLSLQGPADPTAGVHALVALLAALEHRRRTGEGQLIEVAQIEACASVTAEAVISYSMSGVVPAREGNRQRGFVQGLYPTSEEGAWVALSIRDDRDWQQLLAVMESPEPLCQARFATQSARIAAHDEIDTSIAGWTQSQAPDAIVSVLEARRVPVARLLTPDRMYAEPQLTARGFYSELVHPVTGARRYPGWPFRFTPGPSRHHLSPPPTLGQHNQEILSSRLGMSAEEIQGLIERKVIGTKPLNA